MRTDIKIIPLGVGGYIPNKWRETASVLVRWEDQAILFDAGTGVARLLDPTYNAFLKEVKELHLFLSHYHLDHVIGITWLLKVWKGPLHLHAPSRPLVDTTSHEALSKLTEPPLFALPLAQFPFPVNVQPIASESRIAVSNINVYVMQQTHSGGSVGYRLDDRFAYITDTDPDRNHVSFLRDVDLVFMDAMYDMADYRQGGGNEAQKLDHGSSKGVAEVAKKAGVKRLGLIHINPSYDEKRCTEMLNESHSVFGPAFIPKEGVIITV